MDGGLHAVARLGLESLCTHQTKEHGYVDCVVLILELSISRFRQPTNANRMKYMKNLASVCDKAKSQKYHSCAAVHKYVGIGNAYTSSMEAYTHTDNMEWHLCICLDTSW